MPGIEDQSGNAADLSFGKLVVRDRDSIDLLMAILGELQEIKFLLQERLR